MPLGAFRLNSLGKFTVTAAAEVIRSKKSIQAVGNAQVDTAQSKFGGASLLLDGVGDYLLVTNHSTLAHGSENFTIEMWVRFTSQPIAGSYRVFYDARPASTNGAYPVLTQKGTAIVYYANSADRITSGALTTGVWYHVAVSRSGTDTKMFIDGTQVGSTYTDSTTYLSSNLYIGGDSFSNTSQYAGWIDELRVSKTARYTANFTAPTTPFTNDDNTVLLLHMDGTDAVTYFEDDNGIGRAQIGISAHGGATISTTQSKFGGSSLGFGDGVSDYYKVYPISTSYFGGTGDMTFEFWYYRAASGSGLHITDFRSGGGDTAWTIVDFEDGRLGIYQNGYIVATNFGMPTTTWTHVAIVRQGSSLKWYKNGTLTDTNTVSSGAWTNRTDCFIGANFADQSAGNNMNGYIDELRISNIARYTGNFTAPTTPFANDTNTLLLIHADGTNATTVVRDDNGDGRTAIGIRNVNGGTISTAQSKFGGTSLLLTSASSHYLTASSGVSLTDYTIELWYRATTLPGSGLTPFINFNNTLFYIGYSGANTVYDVFSGGSNRVSLIPVTINTGTWYHVAFVRSGSAITVYHNGTSVTTGTWSTAVNWDAASFDIGRYSSYYWNGHFDEIRISNTARYTGNFTPATTQFQNDANTLFLAHFDGTNGSTVFIDDNGKKPS